MVPVGIRVTLSEKLRLTKNWPRGPDFGALAANDHMPLIALNAAHGGLGRHDLPRRLVLAVYHPTGTAAAAHAPAGHHDMHVLLAVLPPRELRAVCRHKVSLDTAQTFLFSPAQPWVHLCRDRRVCRRRWQMALS